MTLRLFTFGIISVFIIVMWLWASAPVATLPKIAGVSLVSPPRPLPDTAFAALKQVNASWVAIIPFAFSRSATPAVTFDHERQWWGERTEGARQMIIDAHKLGLNVMLKPHVWVMGEGWPGEFTLSSEADWLQWEQDYQKYILHFASIADSLNVAMFCIGTEFKHPATKRPAFWRKLSQEVRLKYSGKITYAANWDEYALIDWWDAVDYIGVDAYFPLTPTEKPTVEEIAQGWDMPMQALGAFSDKWDKPIIFTEFGFQSAKAGAGNHWEVDKSPENADEDVQADAYEATFLRLHAEPWFAGGFIWKWYLTPLRHDRHHTDWSPQGKKAERVIGEWYGKFSGKHKEVF